MASWYLAASLIKFRQEINARWPKRDKTSDGAVGDTSHAARASDHNPSPPPNGIVRAIDVDKDGLDPMTLVAAAIAHPATSYVIFNGSIWSRVYNFRRRAYTGANQHEHHVHISIQHTAGAANSTAAWLAPILSAPVLEEDMSAQDVADIKLALTNIENKVNSVIGYETGYGARIENTEQLVAHLTTTVAALRAVLDAVPQAVWKDTKITVPHPVTGKVEQIDMISALGRAASVIPDIKKNPAGALAGAILPLPLPVTLTK